MGEGIILGLDSEFNLFEIGEVEVKDRERCRDCKWYSRYGGLRVCASLYLAKVGINPGQFACKRFAPRDIGARLAKLADEEPSFIAEIH